jgi:dihydrofolate reductase
LSIANTSLDGYIEDESGKFDWAVPDEEFQVFINNVLRPGKCRLYGRRMYQTMAVWETIDTPDDAPFMTGFAEIWRAANKVVYSRTS